MSGIDKKTVHLTQIEYDTEIKKANSAGYSEGYDDGYEQGPSDAE